MTFSQAFSVQLPEWVTAFQSKNYHVTVDPRLQMCFVADLLQMHIQMKTGGPFAAAIFDAQSGELIAVGINLVEQTSLSFAHAEMVALSLAQQKIQSFSLSQYQHGNFRLVTSSEPCAMCYGAIPWAGVNELIIGARADDAEALGFDEGDKPHGWCALFQKRGINVTVDVERERIRLIMDEYKTDARLVYNG
jgi:tRNA(Arg) A34 adenosine deaminase TadA